MTLWSKRCDQSEAAGLISRHPPASSPPRILMYQNVHSGAGRLDHGGYHRNFLRPRPGATVSDRCTNGGGTPLRKTKGERSVPPTFIDTPVRGGSITAAIIEISSGRGRAPREINPDLLSEKSRKAHLVEARSLFCFRAARHLGYAATATASFRRMTRPGAGCAADRGEAVARAKGFVLGEA